MRLAHRAYATTAAAATIAYAWGCTGWGEAPDPGAPASTPSITSLLQLPDGMSLDHVGHVVVDGSTIHAVASAHGESNGATIRNRLLLRKKLAEPWAVIWKRSATDYDYSDAEPRLLAKGDSLYWLDGVSYNSTLNRWSPGYDEPRTLCSASNAGGIPAAIAASGDRIFVFHSQGGTCSFDFRSWRIDCLVPSGGSDLASCPFDATAGGEDAGEPTYMTSVLQGRPLIANGMLNAMVADGGDLYWFESVSTTGGKYAGANLVKYSPGALDDAGGPAPEPTVVATLDVSSYPTGLAIVGGDIYVAASTAVLEDPRGLSGCALLKRAKSGTAKAFDALVFDDSHSCRGLSSDSTHLWFATSWVGFEDGVVREGLARLSLASQSSFPDALIVDRSEISLSDTVMSGESLLVPSAGGLLHVPKSLVP